MHPPMSSEDPVVIEAAVGDVRQSPDTQAVAVCRDADRPDRWAIMTLTEGGHYGLDSEVATWTPLSPETTG